MSCLRCDGVFSLWLSHQSKNWICGKGSKFAAIQTGISHAQLHSSTVLYISVWRLNLAKYGKKRGITYFPLRASNLVGVVTSPFIFCLLQAYGRKYFFSDKRGEIACFFLIVGKPENPKSFCSSAGYRIEECHLWLRINHMTSLYPRFNSCLKDASTVHTMHGRSSNSSKGGKSEMWQVLKRKG